MKRPVVLVARLAGYSSLVIGLSAVVLFAFLRTGALPVAAARPMLEQALWAAAGRRVTLGAVALEWDGLTPRVIARDVRIASPEAPDRILVLPHVRLQFHWWESLRAARPRVRTLAMRGASIRVERLENGRILVHGLSGAHPRDVLRLLKRLLGSDDVRLELENARLLWIDRTRRVRYRFSDLQIAAERRGAHYRIGLRAGLPDELGRTLRLSTTLSGDLDDPRTWTGRAYVRVAGGLLAQGEHWLAVGLTPGGRPLLDAELWVRWAGPRLDEIAGTLSVTDLRLDPSRLAGGTTPGELHVDRLAVRGLWRRAAAGWAAHLQRVHAVVDGELLAETEVTVFATQHPTAGMRYEILAGAVELGPAAALLARLSRVRPYLDVTGSLDAGGRLTDLYLVLTTGNRIDAAINGRFQDSHLFGLAGIPGFYGLDGEFSFDRNGGELALYSEDLVVTHPDLGERPWSLGSLHALLEWHATESGWQIDLPLLSLANAGLRMEAMGWLRTAATGAPYAALDVALHEAELTALRAYLPAKGIPSRVRAWLERSILGGRVVAGTLSLRGPLDRFPFERGGGEFRAAARIRGGVLRPSPLSITIEDIEGDLEWYRASLFARADRFRAGGIEGGGASVSIADLRHAVLELDLSGSGPIRELQEILSEVLRIRKRPDWTRRLTLRGKTGFELALHLPLSRAATERSGARTRGRLDLQGLTLGVEGVDGRLDSITGSLRFSGATVESDDLRARLNGVPIRARLYSEARGVLLALEARAGTAQLWPGLPEAVHRRLSGTSRWRGLLRLPTGARTGLRLRLESDLQGITVDLPGTLGKPSGERRRLTVEAELGAPGRRRVWVDYDGRAALAAVVERVDGGWRPSRGEVRFGAHHAQLPTAGWHIRGRLADLVPAQWLALLPDAERAGLAPPGRVNVDLHVERMELAPGAAVHALHIRGRGTPRRWRLRLESPALSGHVELPRDAGRFVPAEIDLDHVDWPRLRNTGRTAGQSAPVEPDPRDLRAIKLRVSHLELGAGRRIENLRAALTPSEEGLRLQRLVFRAPGLQASASGAWEHTREGRSRVRLQARFESDDVGLALGALRLDEGFHGGAGRLELRVQWSGPPWRPDPATLSGQGVIHLEKGRIENLDPGMARVLGLVNPAALPRRVTLDFRDLLEKGYRYDRIEGAFTIEGAELRVRGLEVAGPAAELMISGRERLDTRQHDLVVHVTPQLGLGPAIAGTVLGGPAVGAVVFVAERLLKKSGADISRVAQLTYRVHGSWNDPRIEPVSEEPGNPAPGDPSEVFGAELLGVD